MPLILAAEIEGIGYTLACDFLKELGFIEYGKPDVHVIEIFVGIGLCPPKPISSTKGNLKNCRGSRRFFL